MNNITQNPVLDCIYSRRSVRKFAEEAVPAELLETLVRAGMAAPSGKNLQPWSFVVVTERTTLDALADALPYAKMLYKAPAAIVVCGNSDTQQGGQSYWYVDCSAATQNILLTATSLGLGAVWTATYPYPERMDPVASVLGIPDPIKSLCVIPVGYPATEHSVKDRYDSQKVHFNKW